VSSIPGATVAVVADDLIWASRLIEAVRRAGATPVRLSSQLELDTALAAAEAVESSDADTSGVEPRPRLVGAVVDVFGHRYDGVAAIGSVAAARVPVIAVAQHDDVATRKRALDAGAMRVFSYNKFATDGPRLVEGWLLSHGGTR